MNSLSFTLTLVLFVAAARADEVSYNRDVRPILSDNCFNCHGPDAGKRDPAELAAWTSVCRVVLNLHEVITRY